MNLKRILLASWIIQLINMVIFFLAIISIVFTILFFLANIAVLVLSIISFAMVVNKKSNLVGYKLVIASSIIGIIFYICWILFFVVVFTYIDAYSALSGSYLTGTTNAFGEVLLFIFVIILGIAFFVLTIIAWVKINEKYAQPNWQLAPGFNNQQYGAQNFASPTNQYPQPNQHPQAQNFNYNNQPNNYQNSQNNTQNQNNHDNLMKNQ